VSDEYIRAVARIERVELRMNAVEQDVREFGARIDDHAAEIRKALFATYYPLGLSFDDFKRSYASDQNDRATRQAVNDARNIMEDRRYDRLFWLIIANLVGMAILGALVFWRL